MATADPVCGAQTSCGVGGGLLWAGTWQIRLSCELPELLLHVDPSLWLDFCVLRLFCAGLLQSSPQASLSTSGSSFPLTWTRRRSAPLCGCSCLLMRVSQTSAVSVCSDGLGVLLMASCHWNILSVVREQADITEFPTQRWEYWGRGWLGKLSYCGCNTNKLQSE